MRAMPTTASTMKRFSSRRKRLSPLEISLILQWACCVGNVAMVEKACLAAQRSWDGYPTWPHSQSLHSSIHFAAWYGHTDVLRLFEDDELDDGVPFLNLISDFRGLPRQRLGDALRHINPAIVDRATGYLRSSDLNLNQGGWVHADESMDRTFVLNSLGIAVLRGHAETAEYLAQFHDESRIDDLQFDEDGQLMQPDFDPITHPLHLACFMGMEGVVKILLDKGADVNAICAPVQWSTPLMWTASRPDNDEILGRLLEKGADVKIRDLQRRSPLVWALQFGAAENACPEHEERSLLRLHPAHLPEVPGSSGIARQEWCIEQNIGLDPIYAEELDGDPNPFSYYKSNCGLSAVHYAAAMKALPIDVLTSALEKRPQDINRPSESGDTPSPWPSPRTTMTLSRSLSS
ncbi:hypothetical protein PG984_014948 [Apiospora sp. TS-2023a]